MSDTMRPEGEQPKKKNVKIKKYKLTVMDYITISFTVVIVLIMAFILLRTIKPEWFTSTNGGTGSPTLSQSATPTPESTPTLSDIGNTYGNLSNNPYVCEIDDRLYFISAGQDGIPYIYVQAGEETKALLQDNASCLNVITDPYTYQDDAKADAYTIFYLDADGNICCITDGPIYDEQPFMQATVAKRVYKEGAYRSIAVRGEYLFFIDGEGRIGKMSLIEESYTVLSQESYTTLSVYGNNIYARSEKDGSLYLLSTVARPAATVAPSETPSASSTVPATPVPGVDEYEMQILTEKVNHFCIDGMWIYTVSDNGLVRRTGDASQKDTLSKRKADFVNVMDDQIFVLSEGTLYVGTATQYMLGTEVAIGSVGTKLGITLTENAVYVYAGGLKVSQYDSETDTYSQLTFVELPQA